MDTSIMPLVRSAATICAQTESSCMLQQAESCIRGETDICTVKFTLILFPLISLLIGAICMPLARYLRISYHLLILGVGVALGLLGCGVDLGLLSVSLRQWVHVNPPAIFLYVFLAPFIFAASFNTSWHVFKRLLIPILTTAFIILALQVGLIGAFQMIVIRIDGWTWYSALMFGAMVSTTDPIGVTTALNSLGASQLLSALADGESLVNQGSAIVLWTGFFVNAHIDAFPNNVTGSAGDVIESTSSAWGLVGDFFRLMLGGVAIGIAFALVALIFLSCVYDELEVETSLTVIVAFLGFWTAQALSELSGVTANIASGLILSSYGRHLTTPSVRKPLREFWNFLVWIGATIVFVHAGVLLSAFAWSCAGEPHEARDYVYIVVWYLFLQVIRIVLFLLFRPILAFRNEWLGWKEAFFLGFSGLRGGLSLILTLEVLGSPAFPEEVKSRVVLWTTGVLALCLLINGSLLKPLIHGFKFDRVEKPKAEFSRRARSIMVQRTLQILDHLCVECGYKSARWSYVIQNVIPTNWLQEAEHVSNYKDAIKQLVSNAPVPATSCLERVCNEERMRVKKEKIAGFVGLQEFAQTLGIQQAAKNSVETPHQDFHLNIRESMKVSSMHRSQSHNPGARVTPQEGQMAHSSSTETATVEHTYSSGSSEGKPLHQTSHSGVPDFSRERDREAGHSEETSRDREVRRRMLTALLSYVRAITNASLVEYSVIVYLEDDVQNALDANGEGKDYDLFSFLHPVKNRRTTLWRRGYQNAIESRNFRGESLITKTVVVVGILTSILRGEMLLSAPRVRRQAEQLYKEATVLLNRLEVLNPHVLGWVTSQFAITLTERSQDSVLSDLLTSGVIDEHEFNAIHTELIQIRRKHVTSQLPLSLRSALLFDPKPMSLIREHPLFAGLNAATITEIVDRQGIFVHLQSGEELKVEKGSLVVVLQGAIRPVEDTKRSSLPDVQQDLLLTDASTLGLNNQLESQRLQRTGASLLAQSNHGDASGRAPNHGVDVESSHCSGSGMHWCFSSGNGFCGHLVTVNMYDNASLVYPVDHDHLLETQFRSCEHAESTTVFTLPVKHVQALARRSKEFRLEITRTLSREIVLNSIADENPYILTNFFQSAPMDSTTVVGRAYQILERIPYMTVVTIRAGKGTPIHLQGPGVLLNGMVQVSITDADGSNGSVNLLHKQLTGPALLPPNGLIIEQVPSKYDAGMGNEVSSHGGSGRQNGDWSRDPATNAKDLDEERQILAHVLIEPLQQPDHSAVQRLKRWTMSAGIIDMNGRFGIHCHVDPASLLDTKVE